MKRREIVCPNCMDKIRQKDTKPNNVGELLCPECGQRLPREFFQCDKYINISIVGLTYCGKTTYMAVMMKEFARKLCEKLYLEPMSDYDDNREFVNETYIKKLYEEKKELGGTHPGGDQNAAKPQIYRIKDRMRNRIGNRNPVYSLTIHDGAGKDCLGMSPHIQKNIEGSDYIFYLIDSKELPAVQRLLGNNKIEENASQQMVKKMAQYLRQALKKKSNELINKPVAVILTKFDVIMDKMKDMQATVKHEKALAFTGTSMTSDLDSVNKEIRSWLEGQQEQQFLSALEANFGKIRFFGVSSLGHEIVNEEVGVVTPHRVLDPILWVLSEEGVIHRVEV